MLCHIRQAKYKLVLQEVKAIKGPGGQNTLYGLGVILVQLDLVFILNELNGIIHLHRIGKGLKTALTLQIHIACQANMQKMATRRIHLTPKGPVKLLTLWLLRQSLKRPLKQCNRALRRESLSLFGKDKSIQRAKLFMHNKPPTLP